MIALTATPVAAAARTRSSLGESPRWDARSQTLWWTDIEGRRIHSLDAEGAVADYALPRAAGSVMLADSGLVLATTRGFERYTPQTGQLETLVEIESADDGRRMNDASVDPWGGILGGAMRWDAGSGAPDGVLYSWREGATPAVVFDALGCPNGLAWPSPGRFVFVDSLSGGIDVWNVDAATGAVGSRASRIDTSSFEGIPDGLTVDERGRLWVAFWGGGVVRCFELDGTVVATVTVGTPFVTSVAFGGSDLETLYITTAAADERGDSAGLLHEVRAGIAGRETYYFES